jgi:hypothetical protein
MTARSRERDLEIHIRMGHPSKEVMRHIPGVYGEKCICETCVKVKTFQSGIKNISEYVEARLGMVHLDVIGPI